MMQDLVGIVRKETEMQTALDGLEKLRERARRVGVGGHREYNPGWHAAIDLPNLLLVSEAVTRSAIERRESRGGHFREDYPDKDPALGKVNIVVRKAETAAWSCPARRFRRCRTSCKSVIEEMK